ncbi:MAG: twin-arginine translocation signal domain-containing protein [Candidatus Absconditicoccaceae bacterium]
MLEKGDNISRRNFLKKLGIVAGSTVVLATGGKLLYNLITDNDEPKDEINKTVNSIREKPIHLGYEKIVKDRDIDFINSTGNKFSTLSRVSRCLRWKPVTDAVEDRYGIPRGLLMAMMAQEGMGDPTMPNLSGDGGLGLIHIQAVNAHDFGLNTLTRYTDGMRDTRHGKVINDTLNSCNKDISKLIEYDDRFHPVMAVDCAARFLMDCKRRAGSGKDEWLHALKKYSGRKYGGKGGYGIYVIKYRAIINDITGDGFPDNFSRNVYQDIQDAKTNNQSIKEKLNNIKFNIDGKIASYEEYLAYFEESVQNFELEKYVALGEYRISKIKKEDTPKEESDKRGEKIKNTMIKSEFVNTRQHNSEGFLLFRYKVKSGDTPTKISNIFDQRDKENGDKYRNTGNLNIVKRNGKGVNNIKEGDIVYIKAKINR